MIQILLAILEEFERQCEESITKKEFLAFAERTEKNFQRVWEAIDKLTEAQKKTEARLNELTEAQKKTEQEVAKLTRGLETIRQQVGGLARSVSYALENDTYRYLPKFLKVRYDIEVIDRLIRTFIKNREINISHHYYPLC